MLKQLDVLIGLVTVLTLVSLFITVINQAILNFLNLRGKNLLDGLEAMFATIAPTQLKNARAVADAVLRHPLISDSVNGTKSAWFFGSKQGLASAIRPEELISILSKLSGAQTNEDRWVGNAERLNNTTIQDLGSDAQIILDVLQGADGQNSAIKSSLVAALRSLHALDPALATAVQDETKILQTLKTDVQSLMHNAEESLNRWFNTMEDRTRQWLSTHAQICTCIVALILAFGLQLDLFQIMRDLNSDDKARAALVASAGKVEEKADEIMKLPTNSGPPSEEKLKDEVKSLQTQAEGIQQQFEKTSFQLIPTNYPQHLSRWLGFVKNDDGSAQDVDAHHFCGMISMFALLCMGTPFWFNILKSLTNFRPALAQAVSNGEDGAAKNKKAK